MFTFSFAYLLLGYLCGFFLSDTYIGNLQLLDAMLCSLLL